MADVVGYPLGAVRVRDLVMDAVSGAEQRQKAVGLDHHFMAVDKKQEEAMLLVATPVRYLLKSITEAIS